MRVTLGSLTIANKRSLIQTTSTVGRSSRVNGHSICRNTTGQINQMKVDTLTIDQSRVKDGSTLSAKQVTISRLPSASLSKLMNLWLRIAMQYLSCALVRGRGIVFRRYYQGIAKSAGKDFRAADAFYRCYCMYRWSLQHLKSTLDSPSRTVSSRLQLTDSVNSPLPHGNEAPRSTSLATFSH